MISIKEVCLNCWWLGEETEGQIIKIVENFLEAEESIKLETSSLFKELKRGIGSIDFFSSYEFYNFCIECSIEPSKLVGGVYSPSELLNNIIDNILDNLKIECTITY